MTAKQLEQIAALRQENYPYSFIGRELGLSPNTVKSICRPQKTGSRWLPEDEGRETERTPLPVLP